MENNQDEVFHLTTITSKQGPNFDLVIRSSKNANQTSSYFAELINQLTVSAVQNKPSSLNSHSPLNNTSSLNTRASLNGPSPLNNPPLFNSPSLLNNHSSLNSHSLVNNPPSLNIPSSFNNTNQTEITEQELINAKLKRYREFVASKLQGYFEAEQKYKTNLNVKKGKENYINYEQVDLEELYVSGYESIAASSNNLLSMKSEDIHDFYKEGIKDIKNTLIKTECSSNSEERNIKLSRNELVNREQISERVLNVSYKVSEEIEDDADDERRRRQEDEKLQSERKEFEETFGLFFLSTQKYLEDMAQRNLDDLPKRQLERPVDSGHFTSVSIQTSNHLSESTNILSSEPSTNLPVVHSDPASHFWDKKTKHCRPSVSHGYNSELTLQTCPALYQYNEAICGPSSKCDDAYSETNSEVSSDDECKPKSVGLVVYAMNTRRKSINALKTNNKSKVISRQSSKGGVGKKLKVETGNWKRRNIEKNYKSKCENNRNANRNTTPLVKDRVTVGGSGRRMKNKSIGDDLAKCSTSERNYIKKYIGNYNVDCSLNEEKKSIKMQRKQSEIRKIREDIKKKHFSNRNNTKKDFDSGKPILKVNENKKIGIQQVSETKSKSNKNVHCVNRVDVSRSKFKRQNQTFIESRNRGQGRLPTSTQETVSREQLYRRTIRDIIFDEKMNENHDCKELENVNDNVGREIAESPSSIPTMYEVNLNNMNQMIPEMKTLMNILQISKPDNQNVPCPNNDRNVRRDDNEKCCWCQNMNTDAFISALEYESRNTSLDKINAKNCQNNTIVRRKSIEKNYSPNNDMSYNILIHEAVAAGVDKTVSTIIDISSGLENNYYVDSDKGSSLSVYSSSSICFDVKSFSNYVERNGNVLRNPTFESLERESFSKQSLEKVSENIVNIYLGKTKSQEDKNKYMKKVENPNYFQRSPIKVHNTEHSQVHTKLEPIGFEENILRFVGNYIDPNKNIRFNEADVSKRRLSKEVFDTERNSVPRKHSSVYLIYPEMRHECFTKTNMATMADCSYQNNQHRNSDYDPFVCNRGNCTNTPYKTIQNPPRTNILENNDDRRFNAEKIINNRDRNAGNEVMHQNWKEAMISSLDKDRFHPNVVCQQPENLTKSTNARNIKESENLKLNQTAANNYEYSRLSFAPLSTPITSEAKAESIDTTYKLPFPDKTEMFLELNKTFDKMSTHKYETKIEPSGKNNWRDTIKIDYSVDENGKCMNDLNSTLIKRARIAENNINEMNCLDSHDWNDDNDCCLSNSSSIEVIPEPDMLTECPLPQRTPTVSEDIDHIQFTSNRSTELLRNVLTPLNDLKHLGVLNVKPNIENRTIKESLRGKHSTEVLSHVLTPINDLILNLKSRADKRNHGLALLRDTPSSMHCRYPFCTSTVKSTSEEDICLNENVIEKILNRENQIGNAQTRRFGGEINTINKNEPMSRNQDKCYCLDGDLNNKELKIKEIQEKNNKLKQEEEISTLKLKLEEDGKIKNTIQEIEEGLKQIDETCRENRIRHLETILKKHEKIKIEEVRNLKENANNNVEVHRYIRLDEEFSNSSLELDGDGTINNSVQGNEEGLTNVNENERIEHENECNKKGNSIKEIIEYDLDHISSLEKLLPSGKEELTDGESCIEGSVGIAYSNHDFDVDTYQESIASEMSSIEANKKNPPIVHDINVLMEKRHFVENVYSTDRLENSIENLFTVMNEKRDSEKNDKELNLSLNTDKKSSIDFKNNAVIKDKSSTQLVSEESKQTSRLEESHGVVFPKCNDRKIKTSKHSETSQMSNYFECEDIIKKPSERKLSVKRNNNSEVSIQSIHDSETTSNHSNCSVNNTYYEEYNSFSEEEKGEEEDESDEAGVNETAPFSGGVEMDENIPGSSKGDNSYIPDNNNSKSNKDKQNTSSNWHPITHVKANSGEHSDWESHHFFGDEYEVKTKPKDSHKEKTCPTTNSKNTTEQKYDTLHEFLKSNISINNSTKSTNDNVDIDYGQSDTDFVNSKCMDKAPKVTNSSLVREKVEYTRRYIDISDCNGKMPDDFEAYIEKNATSGTCSTTGLVLRTFTSEYVDTLKSYVLQEVTHFLGNEWVMSTYKKEDYETEDDEDEMISYVMNPLLNMTQSIGVVVDRMCGITMSILEAVGKEFKKFK